MTKTQGMLSALSFSRRESSTVYHRDRCRRAHGHVHQRGVRISSSASILGLRSRMRLAGLIPEVVTLDRLAVIASRRRTPIAKVTSPPGTQHSATIRDIKAGSPATGTNPTVRGATVGASLRRPHAEAATIVDPAVTEAATTKPRANGPRHMPRHERGHVRLRRSLPPAMPSPRTCRTWSTSFWAWSGPRRKRRRRRLCQPNRW